MRIEIEIKDEEIVRIVNSALDPSPIGKRFYMHGEKSLPCHVSTPGQERTDEVALVAEQPRCNRQVSLSALQHLMPILEGSQNQGSVTCKHVGIPGFGVAKVNQGANA